MLSPSDAPADSGSLQWLHRLAFSYGGLDILKHASSSQSQKNMLFGTRETNTLMIRYVGIRFL